MWGWTPNTRSSGPVRVPQQGGQHWTNTQQQQDNEVGGQATHSLMAGVDSPPAQQPEVGIRCHAIPNFVAGRGRPPAMQAAPSLMTGAARPYDEPCSSAQGGPEEISRFIPPPPYAREDWLPDRTTQAPGFMLGAGGFPAPSRDTSPDSDYQQTSKLDKRGTRSTGPGLYPRQGKIGQVRERKGILQRRKTIP